MLLLFRRSGIVVSLCSWASLLGFWHVFEFSFDDGLGVQRPGGLEAAKLSSHEPRRSNAALAEE